MLKNVLAALGLLALGLGSAHAGNVSTVAGPNDPSQMNSLMNTLIISGNQSWNPGGASFLNANTITNNSTSVITISALGPAGLVTSTIAGWLKVRNPSASVISGGLVSNPPIFYLIPMWGANGP